MNRVFKGLGLESPILLKGTEVWKGKWFYLVSVREHSHHWLQVNAAWTQMISRKDSSDQLCAETVQAFRLLIKSLKTCGLLPLRRGWGVCWEAILIASFPPERTEKQTVQATRSNSLFSGQRLASHCKPQIFPINDNIHKNEEWNALNLFHLLKQFYISTVLYSQEHMHRIWPIISAYKSLIKVLSYL